MLLALGLAKQGCQDRYQKPKPAADLESSVRSENHLDSLLTYR